MAAQEKSFTAELLQEEYVKKHGEVGKVVSKFKKDSKIRFAIFKELTPYFDIFTQRRELCKIRDYPENIQKSVDTLINEYGYFIQSKIE